MDLSFVFERFLPLAAWRPCLPSRRSNPSRREPQFFPRPLRTTVLASVASAVAALSTNFGNGLRNTVNGDAIFEEGRKGPSPVSLSRCMSFGASSRLSPL